MGVAGLETYLRNCGAIRSVELATEIAASIAERSRHQQRVSSAPLPIVLDGSSLLYLIFSTHGTEILSPDYGAAGRCVDAVVAALRAAQLEPIVVLDGAPDPQRLASTVIPRRKAQVPRLSLASTRLFMFFHRLRLFTLIVIVVLLRQCRTLGQNWRAHAARRH